MAKRKIGQFEVEPVGLGCMSLSHAYGTRPETADAEALLLRALDLGYDFLDTAAAYGMGHNETLIGRTLKGRRDQFTLASKCGIVIKDDGTRGVDGTPEGIARVLDLSLQRLGVDHIDLYYLHRLDRTVPIEDSVAALAQAVQAGKIRSIGLSEVSADTLRRAHAVHPIAALQTEYSLWTRNPEIAVLDACRELGTTFVAFSPVGRGFLAGGVPDPDALPEGDLRKAMPRFREPNLAHNQDLLAKLTEIAGELGCTPGQLSLAWLLHRDPTLVTIPGTANIAHLEENFAGRDVQVPDEVMVRLDALINERTVAGGRYTRAMQASIDTEDFANAA